MRKNKEVEFGRRVSEALEKKGTSLHDFAKGIDKSYEMARRYSHGISIPQDPKTLERMAAYFNTSVGWLLAEETGGVVKAPSTVDASDLEAPITKTTVMTVGDDAMLTLVGGIRFFGAGDQVILSPSRARAGDIVAVRHNGTTTLRKLVEDGGVDRLVPANSKFPVLEETLVLGVVSEVRGRSSRFS